MPDLNPGNIMFGLIDKSVLRLFEREERRHPSTRKLLPDRTIYASRPFRVSKTIGYPTLCDFGSARFGADKYRADVMPDHFRAPEVILDMWWDEKIDIWALGLLVRSSPTGCMASS